MAARVVAGVSRLGLAVLGAAAALAATSGVSLAQGGATAAAPAMTAADTIKVGKGRDLFANYGCSGCHSLADAGATGRVGPSLDGNANLTHAFVTDRVTNGQGPMPAFGGQMSPEEIDAVATYVTTVAKKP